MTEPTPETAHFGFTRIDATAESLTKNGGAVLDADRITLDDLIYAALKHTHDGTPALGDPTDPPTFVAVSTGGHLSAATSYYYRVSYVDQWGLESAASPEDFVTTPDPLDEPTAPAAAVEAASGTLAAGIYTYLLTFVDAYGGETTAGAVNNVQIQTGTTNRVLLTLPALETGAVSMNIYRSRPGQSQYYYLANSAATSYYDDGSVAEDQTVTAPTINTTNSANAVQVTIPLGFIPLGCTSWKIYRATESGAYDGNSLVHQVIEPDSDTSTVPRTMWVDTGDVLQQGFPRNSSSTVPQGSLLSLNALAGTLPITTIPRGVRCLAFTAPGIINNGQTVTVTESPTPVKPVRFTVFFKTPPASGEVVTLSIADAASASVGLVCTGDGSTQYFHHEWPLAEAYLGYADVGTRSDVNAVTIITDPVSDSGQSVVLDTQNEWVQVDFSTLDTGNYTAYASIRANSGTVTATNDVRLDIIRTDTNASIANAVFTVSNINGFADQQLVFAAPGGVDLALRVTKVTTAAQSYEVESGRYATSVPSLVAGMLTATAAVTGTASAADANIALWF